MGSKRYRDAKELLITADGGGSDVREASRLEPELAPLYGALTLDPSLGGTRDLVA